MTERELIAERIIWAVDKNGQGFDIGLQIGKPYQTDSPKGPWRCPVAMIGLHGPFPDIYGEDSWQALVLAIDLTKTLLQSFVEDDGGKLFYEKGGQEGTVDEIFGIPYKNPEPDGQLTEEQQARVDQLTAEELQIIDDALLAEASTQFRKVARVVGFAMDVNKDSFKGIPDIFYASRVRKLVEEGRLVSQGNLEYMRFSEVKLPD
jgi:hypothetical protein